jgi:PKD repeat protein
MKRLCKWFVLVVLLASEVLLLGGCIYLQQPRAVLKATPTAGNAPLSVTFNLSESADSNPDGAVVRFELQFGDKSSPVRGEDITQPISHTYSEGGYFTAILIVTNNRGNTGYARVHIEVTGAGVKQPVAALAATPLDGEAPLDVTFDLSGSSDPDGWIVHFELQFGDGGLQTGSSMPAQIEHTYADDGFYTAVLEITDNEGLTDYEKVHIAVANPQPVVLLECTPNPAELGELVTCEACSSVDPAGLSLEPRSIIAYEWDFGDGSADFGSCTTTHAYKALGDYEVTLTIFDDDGASVTGSTTVSVQFRESAFVYWSWFDTDSWNGGVKRCPIGGGRAGRRHVRNHNKRNSGGAEQPGLLVKRDDRKHRPVLQRRLLTLYSTACVHGARFLRRHGGRPRQ